MLPLALGLAACGGSAKELALVRDELAKVQRDHDALEKRVEGLETRDALAKHEGGPEGAPVVVTAAEGPGPEADKPLKVVKLEPKAPVAPEPTPVEEDDAPRPSLTIGPTGAIEQFLPDDAPSKSKKSVAKPSIDPDAAKDYDHALALVKGKKHKLALDALAGFLVRYPDHPYAANALYWRGECYYALGDFSAAVGQFEALIARFPVSPKAADGLLKLGLSHKKLGSPGKAHEAFARLRKDFPTSEAAKKIPPEEAS